MSVHVVTVTIGPNPTTPFLAKAVQPANSLHAQCMVIQYPGSGTAYIGDSAVSSTNGIALTSSSAPLVIPLALTDNNDLYSWFVAGTNGQKLTVLYLD